LAHNDEVDGFGSRTLPEGRGIGREGAHTGNRRELALQLLCDLLLTTFTFFPWFESQDGETVGDCGKADHGLHTALLRNVFVQGFYLQQTALRRLKRRTFRCRDDTEHHASIFNGSQLTLDDGEQHRTAAGYNQDDQYYDEPMSQRHTQRAAVMAG